MDTTYFRFVSFGFRPLCATDGPDFPTINSITFNLNGSKWIIFISKWNRKSLLAGPFVCASFASFHYIKGNQKHILCIAKWRLSKQIVHVWTGWTLYLMQSENVFERKIISFHCNMCDVCVCACVLVRCIQINSSNFHIKFVALDAELSIAYASLFNG